MASFTPWRTKDGSTIVKRLYQLVDEQSVVGRRFAWFIQLLIIVSITTFTIETLPDLAEGSRRLFDTIELVVVLIFTFEYILRVLEARDKLRFIFSFYGLVDLIAILPFYIATGLDLRSVRILRLLRLIRILKLFRYNRAAQRLLRAFNQVRDEMVLFIFMISILLYLSAVGIYYFENDAQPDVFKSVPHSMWWAVATLTTVGYGDIYPITAGGRFFTFVVLIIGLGIIAVPTGLIASALTDARNAEQDEEQVAGNDPPSRDPSEQG
jgi:voltage-gated potassium channel